MKDLSDYISPENRIKFGESMHWVRNERRLSIEETAKKTQSSIDGIDALETGRGQLDLPLACKLLELYKEKVFINVESYND